MNLCPNNRCPILDKVAMNTAKEMDCCEPILNNSIDMVSINSAIILKKFPKSDGGAWA